MSEAILTVDSKHLITEDNTPVDNFLTEKQERLLTEPLYSCWKADNNRTFLVAANVGVFNSIYLPAIVPDVFLSMDVEIPVDWWEKEQKSYFTWEFGKPPNIVIEIVSNKVGEETTKKMTRYAQMGVTYYIIFDPFKKLSEEVLRIYALQFSRYIPHSGNYFFDIGLGLALWEGDFENTASKSWLRWTNEQGQIIPTGIEKAEIEKQRAERLAAKLRELGIDPSTL